MQWGLLSVREFLAVLPLATYGTRGWCAWVPSAPISVAACHNDGPLSLVSRAALLDLPLACKEGQDAAAPHRWWQTLRTFRWSLSHRRQSLFSTVSGDDTHDDFGNMNREAANVGIRYRNVNAKCADGPFPVLDNLDGVANLTTTLKTTTITAARCRAFPPFAASKRVQLQLCTRANLANSARDTCSNRFFFAWL